MSTKRTVQYILGYVVGGLLFLILIPWGLCRASRAFDHLTGIQLIPIAGIALLLASVIAGAIWSAFGASAAFMTGAVFAALASIGLLAYKSRAHE